ncbi:MAG TPA: SDR family NAD(P)-dependent oxidoreductase, partial [Polyangiaceae bacterium]|nr:SDR family NAD(P)-dependent oxidoreductase [Polyangiaceae bacterium]
MARLTGRRILITGISRGIGFETAKLFLSEGAHLLGVGKDPERLERARQLLDPSGERLAVVAADLESPEATAQIVQAAERRFSGLDVLLNNAGVQIDGDTQGFEDNSEKTLERSLAINLMAPYRLCLALLPLLRRGNEPRILNVSSGAGTFAALTESRIATY